jgi:hypothetical protein
MVRLSGYPRTAVTAVRPNDVTPNATTAVTPNDVTPNAKRPAVTPNDMTPNATTFKESSWVSSGG